MKLDPTRWSAVYDERNATRATRRFTRGVEIACELYQEYSDANQLWLDAGCGTGNLAKQLASIATQKGSSILAVDFDPDMLSFGKSHAPQFEQANNPSFLCGDAQQLPFADASLDGVLATSLLGCLNAPEKHFRETHRVLKPGGIAVITFTNEKSLFLKTNNAIRFALNRVRQVHRKGQKYSSKKAEGAGDADQRFRHYSVHWASHQLEQTGFRVQRVIFYNFFLELGNRILLPPFAVHSAEQLSRVHGLRELGQNFVVAAKRIGP